jgi:uncharacterized protein (TIGR02594 family)
MIVSVPTYFLHALTQLHVHETAGPAATKQIVDYWKEGQLDTWTPPEGDETPWCAAFVCAMLERGGMQSTRKANAKSFIKWGQEVAGFGLLGAVVVMNRASGPPWQGHVGFCCGFVGENVHVLGGNQGNQVSIASFPKSRIVAVRYPLGIKPAEAAFFLPPTTVEPSVA